MYSAVSIIQQIPPEIQNNPKALENHNIYLRFHPILHDLCIKLFSNPKSIVAPYQIPPSRDVFIIINHLEQLIHINTDELYRAITILDLFTLKFCEFYLLGLETTFENCYKCSHFSINYQSYTICACDQNFIEELNMFKNWFAYKAQLEDEIIKNEKINKEKEEIIKLQNQKLIEEEQKKKNIEKKLIEEKKRKEYMEKHPPFNIWDKVEKMLQSYLKSKKAKMYELRIFYDCNHHKVMWERIDELHEFIISRSEYEKYSLTKSLKHDGKNSCLFVLVDVAIIETDRIQLKSQDSLVVLYELIISH